MAEEEAKALSYIPETILKKRKTNEEVALRRKAQLELRKHASKKDQKEYIKKPEEFVKEFHYREVDLVRMRHRLKKKRPELVTPKSKLLFIIRIQGTNDMHPAVRKTLYNLRLRKVFSAVFVKVNASVIEKLQRVEPYVTYGYPNLKNVKELIHKKGFGNVAKQRVPLTDNNVIEQALGQHGILCIEDLVHEIANVGPHFKEVAHFLYPFMLNKPQGGLKGIKKVYKDGGESGNREDHINELIDKMN
ncbi:large ribosomal subunit protein uL30z-like [Cannabis sativa]|uniref:large ribosomal subunit protein uL30z-like n=1 Tax=Cannabis sativa TaxID=3483 RepID=UPI0029C9EFFC|nr:large ribosomal subunit protein uL30z-like [Cannabis sativa]